MKCRAAADGTAPRSMSIMKNPPIRFVSRTLRPNDMATRNLVSNATPRCGMLQGADTINAPEPPISLARFPELNVAKPEDVGGVATAESVGHNAEIVLCPITQRRP